MTSKRESSFKTQIIAILIPLIRVLGRSAKFWILLILIIGTFFIFRKCNEKQDTSEVVFNSALIQKQINNVSKLVVTEGHFTEVLTYKDQKKYLLDLVSFESKALIVANATVTVAYDMSQIKYDIDEKEKTITISNIPNPEIKIYPDLDFYDIDQSKFNPFTAEDYNKISKKVKEDFKNKIEKSTLKTNAHNRLVSELAKLLILTNTMGWKLEYNNQEITSQSTLKKQIKL